jgi:AraC-like DNA-binding protein
VWACASSPGWRGVFWESARRSCATAWCRWAIESAHGEVDVDRAADQAGMGARQFRRRVREETGLARKRLARMPPWLRAANRGRGWRRRRATSDQAHLIRDFREFAGATPMSDFSRTRARRNALGSMHEDYAGSDRG